MFEIQRTDVKVLPATVFLRLDAVLIFQACPLAVHASGGGRAVGAADGAKRLFW